MGSGSITLWQIEGETVEAVTNFIFLGSKITVGDDLAMKLKDVLWKENYDKPRQHIKKQTHHFANKGLYSQSDGFSSSHAQM